MTEIDPRQVIRAFPKADAANAEVDDLAHVEFDRPDLPWLFTPAGPDAAGAWCRGSRSSSPSGATSTGASSAARCARRADPPRSAAAARRRLGLGARAGHGRQGADRRDRADARAAARARPTPRTTCRGSSARGASTSTRYVACVVPTFLAGAQAGLGLHADHDARARLGHRGRLHGRRPGDMVALPVYYSWSFATGEDGNFESLARKLQARGGAARRRPPTGRRDAPWPAARARRGRPRRRNRRQRPRRVAAGPAEERARGAVADRGRPALGATSRRAHREAQQRRRPGACAGPGTAAGRSAAYGSNHARQPRMETEAPAAARSRRGSAS